MHMVFRHLFLVDVVMFAMVHSVLHLVMPAFDMLMLVMMHHCMAIFDVVSSTMVHMMFIHLMLRVCVGCIIVERRVFELCFINRGFLLLSCLWPSVSPVKPDSGWAEVCSSDDIRWYPVNQIS